MEKDFVKRFGYVFVSASPDIWRHLGKGLHSFHYGCGRQRDNSKNVFARVLLPLELPHLPVKEYRIPQYGAKPGEHFKTREVGVILFEVAFDDGYGYAESRRYLALRQPTHLFGKPDSLFPVYESQLSHTVPPER